MSPFYAAGSFGRNSFGRGVQEGVVAMLGVIAMLVSVWFAVATMGPVIFPHCPPGSVAVQAVSPLDGIVCVATVATVPRVR